MTNDYLTDLPIDIISSLFVLMEANKINRFVADL